MRKVTGLKLGRTADNFIISEWWRHITHKILINAINCTSQDKNKLLLNQLPLPGKIYKCKQSEQTAVELSLLYFTLLRRLVMQPGGLASGFALHLVCIIRPHRYTDIFRVSVCLHEVLSVPNCKCQRSSVKKGWTDRDAYVMLRL